MGGLSNWAENKVIDFAFRNQSFAQSTHLYVALCTSNPGEAAIGATLPEPTNGWYARQQCDSWSAASGRSTSNSNALTWSAVTTASETITHFAIVDSSSGAGNVIAYGAFSASKTFAIGSTPKVNASGISVSFQSGGVNNYLANKLLDHIFKNTAYTPVATVYAALSTANPTDADSGLAEPSAGYARTSVAFAAASGGSSSNSADRLFPEATGSQGTLTYASLRDASSGGNALAYAALSSSAAIGTGDIPEFLTGNLVITVD